jgi:cation diffusion facilitator family transporter
MLHDLGMRISFITLIINIVLSGYKLLTGITGNSAAMVADGVHSLSDVFTTVIVIVSLKIAQKPADKEHPYGHGRAESIAAKILGLALMIVSVSVAKTGIHSLTKGSVAPSLNALIAAVVSIVIKEAMYQITVYAGRKQQSQALIADAWHHRSDAFSSIGTMIGIFAARKGFYFMDGIGALIVSILIFQMGLVIWKKTVEEIMDTQKQEDVRERITKICNANNVLVNEELLRLRHYGNTIFAEMTIRVPANATVSEAHDLTEQIRQKLLDDIESLYDIIIHVDPIENLLRIS